MASLGTVRLANVWKALDVCLPGWRKVKKVHNWWVLPPNNAPRFNMPLGGHGARVRVDVERGHVKRMARQFGIEDCVKRNVKGL